METRRQFLKKAAILSGALGLTGGLVDSIRRAQAIAPDEGSTFWDAEHVVILMQENRSFDHAFGSLQGVRGFDDPRAMPLANGCPVWIQSNRAGESYAPFHLDIKKTRATWMGSIPHGWSDQVDARNGGLYDGWIDAKRSGDAQYSNVPLTMGYYTRQDIPFYYDFADAFTICDQNFCSSLTGTTPNRLHLWTGTIRPEQSPDAPAMVLNSDVDYPSPQNWTTFPERLEDANVSWKIYQNELWVGVGFQGEEDPWLGNFGDNPIEYFSQFHVNLAPQHCRHLAQVAKSLEGELADLEQKRTTREITEAVAAKLAEEISEKSLALESAKQECARWNDANFERLSPREQSLHTKAFCTNVGDPNYHTLAELNYDDDGTPRNLLVPKGDLLHQFREDVTEGKLPTVSWVVPPERFSDHPCSAWFGAWYIAEMLDILTQNPEVWKKTIFILTYDENDGYFDHVPPFVSPHPKRPETGKVSDGVDAALEYVELEQDKKRKPENEARDSPIGLGYRVPMIIASPWTRGGCVCSQVFDHTSTLQFLEKFLSKKTDNDIRETNINSWRRTVCGDLTSAFQAAAVDELHPVPFPTRDAFLEQIHRAQFMDPPSDYKKLSNEEIEDVKRDALKSQLLPRQEPGTRRSCPLPYELHVDGALTNNRKQFKLTFGVGNKLFGDRAAGSPFVVYSRHGSGNLKTRNYAVVAGDKLEDSWELSEFENGRYDLVVYGPNGFFREFRGGSEDPRVNVAWGIPSVDSRSRRGVGILLKNEDAKNQLLEIADAAYGNLPTTIILASGASKYHGLNFDSSQGWYDVKLRIDGAETFARRYAGRIETGEWSITDPVIGRS